MTVHPSRMKWRTARLLGLAITFAVDLIWMRNIYLGRWQPVMERTESSSWLKIDWLVDLAPGLYLPVIAANAFMLLLAIAMLKCDNRWLGAFLLVGHLVLFLFVVRFYLFYEIITAG